MHKQNSQIPIIDLFAGPGGLGEGFSSIEDSTSQRRFRIMLSVEMDKHAHRTLELRAFLRNFPLREMPDEYYRYLQGELTRDELFAAYPKEATDAANEAWHAELGSEETPSHVIDARIRKALVGRKEWILIGGPPCQAYSLVGRSRRRKDADFEKDHKHLLYRQYLRILAEHKPPVFVMENVKGLLSATLESKSTFARILEDLRHPLAAMEQGAAEDLEYEFYPLSPGNESTLDGSWLPQDFLIKCENFGIPQARHRIIIVGVRKGWSTKPGRLDTTNTKVTVQQAIGDLPRLRSGLSKEEDTAPRWQAVVKEVSMAILHCGEPLEPKLRDELISHSDRISGGLGRGGLFTAIVPKPKQLAEWYWDPRMPGTVNHETRGHIRSDLQRYFFASVFAKVYGRSPLLEDFPRLLLPDHKNVESALLETKFNDRFRVQLRRSPSTTIVSHISKDGHYFIHHDPIQCRSLTVREAARLQTFPDNYFFEGPRTEQYKQVGNAVPPLLASQIGQIVADLF